MRTSLFPLFFIVTFFLFVCSNRSSNENQPENIISHSEDTCGNLLVDAALKNDFKTVRFLIRKGCDANSVRLLNERSSICALQVSAMHTDDSITLFLLEHGADPNLNLGASGTPFICAAGSASLATLKLLEAKGGDVNTFSMESNYQTPLQFAIASDLIDNVRFLLDCGARVEADSASFSQSALGFAISQGRYKIAKLLLNHGVDINGICYINIEDSVIGGGTVTPLHIVVLNYGALGPSLASEFLDLLLAYKPDVNIESEEGLTALAYLCMLSNDVELADRLLKNGAKLETNGHAAICSAALLSNYTMVDYLLKMGANPNAPAWDGNTALMISYECCGDGMGSGITNEERLKATATLLEYGADPRIKNHKGETFIDMCKRNRHPEITQLMIQKGFMKQSDIQKNAD